MEWEAEFGDDVPCAASRRIEDMFDHPQVQAQGIIGDFEHPVVGRYRGVAQSIQFGRTPGPQPFAAPALGQDTDSVLGKPDRDMAADRKGGIL
jgi:crotonobetainyl-CoA:carnitine CoA-transferase CaiB-like acyl-CoA transferase